MRIKQFKRFAFLIAVVSVLAGCSAPKKEPAPPTTIAYNSDFIADEGAHFELPNEFWYVTGKLDSKKGPYYFTAHFHKAGSEYIHTRNGYNSLRAPDGKYDYRSFGQGLARRLAENYLKEKIDKFPGDKRYPGILEKLQNDKSVHFYTMSEEERSLYRGRLFIDFGKNHFERTGETELKYSLKLDTWAGPLDLKMEALTNPLTFPARNPMKIGEGNMQGYFFPRMKVEGTIKGEDGDVQVSGTAWYNHLFGRPHISASARDEIIAQRLDNGATLVIACFYNSYGELKNTNIAYMKPDGSVDHSWTPVVKPLKEWKSDISRTTYPIAWKIEGGDISGTVRPLYDKAEVMLDEGVGPFWLGPCEFSGRLGKNPWRNRVKGEGFCRVVGKEEKPKP